MSPQQFSLRWNNHTKNLVQVFADQFEREQHVDVTISCQGRYLKAHKIVLGACSPYFQDLFDAHETATHPIIIMNGYNFEDVRSIVEFMYRGEVMVAETAMQRLLAAAEDLQIKGLSNVRNKRDSQQQQSQYGSEGEQDHHAHHHQQHTPQHNIENGGLSPQGSCRSDGSGGQQPQQLTRSRSNSNSFTAPSPVIGNGGAENSSAVGGSNNNEGRPVGNKRGRKRARTLSYDTEMKRKLRVHKFAQQAAQDQNPEDSNAISEGNPDQSTSPSSKDDFNMTINIEPPMMLRGDEDDDEKHDSTSVGTNELLAAVPTNLIKMPEPEVKEKIPRPPNSFMIFANEWRRQLAGQFPNESNKEISVRLGLMWKGLTEEVKAKYFTAARRANDDHKKKYPDYHYNPKEARMRKMWKLQQQSMGHLVTATHH